MEQGSSGAGGPNHNPASKTFKDLVNYLLSTVPPEQKEQILVAINDAKVGGFGACQATSSNSNMRGFCCFFNACRCQSASQMTMCLCGMNRDEQLRLLSLLIMQVKPKEEHQSIVLGRIREIVGMQAIHGFLLKGQEARSRHRSAAAMSRAT